jgi:hypothetical protein
MFWIEDQSRDVLADDQIALVHAVKRLLQSPCTAAILAAATFLFYCAPMQHVNSSAKPLLRLLYKRLTIAELSLITIPKITLQ